MNNKQKQTVRDAEQRAREFAQDRTLYENEAFWEIAERLKAALEDREYDPTKEAPFTFGD